MRKWMERRAGAANCSPALVVLGMVIAVAITCYIYRHIIEETLIAFLEAMAVILVILATAVILINYRRWAKRRTAAAIEAEMRAHGSLEPEAVASPVLEPAAAMPDADAAMKAAAEWLKDEGTELAWTADGKLVAKGDGAP